MSDGPRIGSICSGMGGLCELGLAPYIGGRVVWHVDNDPGATKILTHHWPETPNYGDLKTVDWSTVEPVDWLTAGYPCPPFSTAGRRLGDQDERHLWPYVARAVGALRPRRVLLENVAGHVSLGLDTVLGDLADMRYDAARDWKDTGDFTARPEKHRLPHTVKAMFPTPRATDGTNGGPNQRGSSGDLMLPSAVTQLLPTPDAYSANRGGGTVQ